MRHTPSLTGSVFRSSPPPISSSRFLVSFEHRFLRLLQVIGGVFFLAKKSVLSLCRHHFAGEEFLYQVAAVGNQSISIVWLIAIFTGMVFALQLSVGLGRFGLKLYIGQIVGIAILRELGPVLTCLMIAARVGSGIAAEIGSMVVTEQVLAIEAIGADPVQKLVVPRLVATFLSALVLTVMADVIGVIGGAFVAHAEAHVTFPYYYDQFRTSVLMQDFTSGIVKAGCFGIFIALIACYHGLQTSGGTEGVGKSTTRAVVHASTVIFISDFFLTKLFLLF